MVDGYGGGYGNGDGDNFQLVLSFCQLLSYHQFDVDDRRYDLVLTRPVINSEVLWFAGGVWSGSQGLYHAALLPWARNLASLWSAFGLAVGAGYPVLCPGYPVEWLSMQELPLNGSEAEIATSNFRFPQLSAWIYTVLHRSTPYIFGLRAREATRLKTPAGCLVQARVLAQSPPTEADAWLRAPGGLSDDRPPAPRGRTGHGPRRRYVASERASEDLAFEFCSWASSAFGLRVAWLLASSSLRKLALGIPSVILLVFSG